MTLILFLAVVIMGILLADMRGRLARLEREVREDQWAARFTVRSAREIVAPPPVSDDGIVTYAEAPPPPMVGAPVDPATMIMPEPLPERPSETVEALEAMPADASDQPVDLAEERAPDFVPDDTPTLRPAMRGSSAFEDLFGRKLPIWAGGITLLVAAVLLVKYSIDAGLLSPVVRVVLGALFGGALIAGAEVARRKAELVRDPRIAQSFAGAGVGSLYAATLAAANLYGLMGPGTAFAVLAAITALAMGLALRFGPPCAVLGLVGGLATPALIDSGAPNVPLLCGYLAIVIGSLSLLSRRQRWFWLGISALIGGMGWTALLVVAGALSGLSMLSVGLLVLLLGLALPMLSDGDHRGMAVRGVAAIFASLQLALLVANGGFDALSWGLYGLLSLAFVWLTTRVPALRPAMAIPLATSLILAGLWPMPPLGLFSAVLAAILAIFAGSALWRLWRPEGGLVETLQIAGAAIAGYVLCHVHYFADGADTRFALLALLFATLPAAGAALGWRHADRTYDARFALLVLASGLLVAIAGLVGLPDWSAPICLALVAGGLLALAIGAADNRIATGGLAFLAAMVGLLAITGAASDEFARGITAQTLERPLTALLRWGAASFVMAAYAWWHRGDRRGAPLQILSTLLLYGFVAQAVPAPWLALTCAILLLGLSEAKRRAWPVFPAIGTLAGIVLLWSLEPLGRWLTEGLASLGGMPMIADSLPLPADAIRLLLAPALLGSGALYRFAEHLPVQARRAATIISGGVALVGLHILYKQLFHLEDGARFIALGLAERTLWEALLFGAGVASLFRMRNRLVGFALLGAGLAHLIVHSLLLHDPFWAQQAVGSWPLANLLAPMFTMAFAAPLLISRFMPERRVSLARPGDLWQMMVIAFFAFACLRQIFAGSVFAGARIGPVENIGWSVLTIALAIGYLFWGIRKGLRDWRVVSLLAMLAAVAKVFLLDAAGLEGLLRIASFLALGFSLIGLGWLYSRFLRPDAA